MSSPRKNARSQPINRASSSPRLRLRLRSVYRANLEPLRIAQICNRRDHLAVRLRVAGRQQVGWVQVPAADLYPA